MLSITTKKQAYKILDITTPKHLTNEIIKKQYHIQALKYHPDKNKNPDAHERFQEVNNAYVFLSKTDSGESSNFFTEDRVLPPYSGLLFSFIQYVCHLGKLSPEYDDLIFTILTKISGLKGDFTFDQKKDSTVINSIKQLLKRKVEILDRDVLVKIYEMIYGYREVFQDSDFVCDILKEIIEEKVAKDLCIILHPTLDDLFEEKIYKYCEKENNEARDNDEEEESFIVPLWHHELLYEKKNGLSLTIQCVPCLQENVKIDSKNNITVILHYPWTKIIDESTIHFSLGKRSFSFEKSLLKIEREQWIILRNQGISRIHREMLLNTAERGDILIHFFIINEESQKI